MNETIKNTTNKCDDDPIFISFNESIPKSKSIAIELENFFQLWGRKCELILHKRSGRIPKETIMQSVIESKVMLQLYSEDTKPSAWMERELHWFEAHNVEPNAVKYLYTEDTDNNDPFQRDLYRRSKRGDISYVKIDDENEAESLLSSILFEKNYACSVRGNVVLPSFCQSQRSSGEISLLELEEFIKNFRDANIRGLVSVYPDKVKAIKRIASRLDSMKKGELVRMIGFTLHRYVHPDNKKGIGKKFVKAIQRGGDANLLILNRSCSAAKERMGIESNAVKDSDFDNAILSQDNIAVSNYYAKDNGFAGKVVIRYYKTPYVGMVLFNDIIFVEIYHLGDDKQESEEKTICGRVPVLVVRDCSPFYNIFNSHFDRVWEGFDQNLTSC